MRTPLRLGIVALLTVTTLALIPVSNPAGAAVDYEGTTEQVMEAAFHLTATVDLTVRAVRRAGLAGSDADPATHSTTEACFTLTRGAQSLERCGPATMRLDPLLDSGSVTAIFSGYELRMSFAAAGPPQPDPEIDPTFASTAVGFSRTGSAAVELIGNIFGDPVAQGSSWYAEAEERVKSSANGR